MLGKELAETGPVPLQGSIGFYVNTAQPVPAADEDESFVISPFANCLPSYNIHTIKGPVVHTSDCIFLIIVFALYLKCCYYKF